MKYVTCPHCKGMGQSLAGQKCAVCEGETIVTEDVAKAYLDRKKQIDFMLSGAKEPTGDQDGI